MTQINNMKIGKSLLWTLITIGLTAQLTACGTTTPAPEQATQCAENAANRASEFASVEDARAYGELLAKLAESPGQEWSSGTRTAGSSELAAFVVRPHLEPGDKLEVALHTDTPQPVTVEVLRVSGGTPGAILMAESTTDGTVQPEARLIEHPLAAYYSFAEWKPTWTMDIPTDEADGWLSGYYVVRLTLADGAQRRIPFVLRDPEAPARLLVVLPVMTQLGAYNRGILGRESSKSLYKGWDGKSYDQKKKAAAVSLQRPCEPSACAGRLFNNTIPLIRYLESRGIPVAYTSDWAVHEDPAELLRYPAVVWDYHPEYVSSALYEAAIEAAEAGVNFLSLMSNGFYWKVEMETNEWGETVMFCNRADQANQWRHQVSPTYGAMSEQRLFYSSYPDEGGGWGDAVMPLAIEPAPDFPPSGNAALLDHWIFADSQFQLGDRVEGTIGGGGDIDRIHTNHPVPDTTDLVVLESTYVNNRDVAYPVHSVYFERPCGQKTFHAGSMIMQNVLDDDALDAQKLQHLIQNIIEEMIGKAAVVRPSAAPPAPD